MSIYQPCDTTALYAFSADPITYGHINIIERMISCYPRCIIAIGRNPTKKYLFSVHERQRMAAQSLDMCPNVEVRAFTGMAVDFAFTQGAQVIIKGVRSAEDLAYEQVLHQVGVSQKMGVDTHVLFADPQLAHVSSSVVKAMQREHAFIHDYVPPAVKAALEARLSGQLLVGLTGDIASGKSTLARALVAAGRRRGIEVHNIDLDLLAHQVLAGQGMTAKAHREFIQRLQTLFGSVVEDGVVDRGRLAERVFADRDKRAALQSLMSQQVAVLLRRALQRKRGVILLNSALLVEFELLGLCNYRAILCEVDAQDQQRRLRARGLTVSQIRARLAAQKRGEEKGAGIAQAIAKQRFGKLWHYTQGDEVSLLDTVLNECEEFAWTA